MSSNHGFLFIPPPPNDWLLNKMAFVCFAITSFIVRLKIPCRFGTNILTGQFPTVEWFLVLHYMLLRDIKFYAIFNGVLVDLCPWLHTDCRDQRRPEDLEAVLCTLRLQRQSQLHLLGVTLFITKNCMFDFKWKFVLAWRRNLFAIMERGYYYGHYIFIPLWKVPASFNKNRK